eukprot:m.1230952 g.1230952  ORF g.1230952 m.1230952 type:complete len:261 (-) comp24657_c0_seq1:925-1707(-)
MTDAWIAPVRISKDDKKGRRVIAISDIPSGAVLGREDPFAHVLQTSELSNRCHECIQEAASLQRCSRCKTVRYCSRRCQKQGWRAHKAECDSIQRVPTSAPWQVRLLARVARQGGLQAAPLQTLVHHQECVTRDLHVEHVQLLTLLHDFLGSEDQGNYSASDMITMLCRVSCNSFGLCKFIAIICVAHATLKCCASNISDDVADALAFWHLLWISSNKDLQQAVYDHVKLCSTSITLCAPNNQTMTSSDRVVRACFRCSL